MAQINVDNMMIKYGLCHFQGCSQYMVSAIHLQYMGWLQQNNTQNAETSQKFSKIQNKATIPLTSTDIIEPLSSLKPSDTQNKATTLPTVCNDTTPSTSTGSSSGKVTTKEVVYTPYYKRYKQI